METKEASIGVRGVERLEAVAEIMLHSERRQPAGLILEIRRYHQPCQLPHSPNSFQLSCFHKDHRQDNRVECFAEGELNLGPSCGQQMRLTGGKATDNGLRVHTAKPFPSPAAEEELVCTRSGRKWEAQGLPVAAAGTVMPAGQTPDENECNAGVLNKFHLLCSCKTSLHHEITDCFVLLPSPPLLSSEFVRVGISC